MTKDADGSVSVVEPHDRVRHVVHLGVRTRAFAFANRGLEAPSADVSPSADWLLGFIPANPIAAAADGQMVGIVMFALLFGFAATRIADDPRQRLLGFLSDRVLVWASRLLLRWRTLEAHA